MKEFIINIGQSSSGNAHKRWKKYFIENDLDFTHFKKTWSSKERLCDEIFINGSIIDQKSLKSKILKYNLIEYKCKCGNKGEWEGKIIVLQLDHVNGINTDNRLENLRFLCPNCHSQTETHSGKNNKNNIKQIITYYCECGNTKSKSSKTCDQCFKLKSRKIKNRPSLEILLNDVKNLGYKKTGLKYNVSDNSIRKWINNYTKN